MTLATTPKNLLYDDILTHTNEEETQYTNYYKDKTSEIKDMDGVVIELSDDYINSKDVEDLQSEEENELSESDSSESVFDDGLLGNEDEDDDDEQVESDKENFKPVNYVPAVRESWKCSKKDCSSSNKARARTCAICFQPRYKAI